MKNNICIIGLATNFIKTTSKQLADKLDMYYADVNDLLLFDLLDLKEAEKKSGKEYILKLESGKIKMVAGFENTVITLNYASLTQNNNYEILQKNTLIIYLKLDKILCEQALSKNNLSKSKMLIEKSVFNDRDKICSKICDVIVRTKSLEYDIIVDNLIKSIRKYYKLMN